MASRAPKKNRINMHDIVGQPLGALPDAVASVLRHPELLDDAEVRGILNEVSFIFLRAEESLAAGNAMCLCALFRLLSEAFAHSDESFADGIQRFARSTTLLSSLRDVFRVSVLEANSAGAASLHSAANVEIVQVIAYLCDGAATKEACGELFMSGLVSYLAKIDGDARQAIRNFHAQRAVATALINLVKGSKQNKVRLPSWRVVASACARSVDVFFQLQCVELLFRVSRPNKAILDDVVGCLRPDAVQSIRELPNDTDLLQRMLQVLSVLNSGREDVLLYPVARVDAGQAVVSEATKVYFTPHYLVVMVTQSNADNVTIPYSYIRSVTLGKDGRVIVRLDEFPVKLETFLSRNSDSPTDTVTMWMETAELAQFKASAIHGWIVGELTAKKEAQKRAKDAVAENPTARPAASANVHQRSVSGDLDILATSKRAKVETTSSALPPLAPQPAAESQLDLAALLRQCGDDGEALLRLLSGVTDSKAAETKAKVVETLNHVVLKMQSVVDAERASIEERRSQSQKALRNDAAALYDRLSATETQMDNAVHHLNDVLCNVKSANYALNEQLACLDMFVRQTTDSSCEESVRNTRQMKQTVEFDLAAVEAEWSQLLLERTRPDNMLVNYISTRLRTNAQHSGVY